MDSGDELQGYSEAPVKRPHSRSTRPAATHTSSRAGPSKSSSHRGTSSATHEHQGSESEVEADMDMEESRANGKGKHVVRKTVTAANASSAAARGRGRPKKITDLSDEEEEEVVSRHGRSKIASTGPTSVKSSKTESELRRRLEEVTRQRDAYAEQFDTLVRQKGTEHELLFNDYKRIAEERAKDQSRLIAQLQAQVAHLQEANRKGHGLPMPVMPDPRHDQEREEWEDKEREWRRKEEELRRQLAESQAMLTRLRDDRPIQPAINGQPPRSGVPPSTPTGKHGTGPTKNSIVICLYEDLTNLLVTKCTIVPGQYGEEHVFLCVLSSHGKSLQFSLRTFRVLKDPPEPKDPYEEKVIYNPLELDKETDREWVERLDFLKDQFTFDRNQMNIFLATAHNKMDTSTEVEEEDDEAKMEEED